MCESSSCENLVDLRFECKYQTTASCRPGAAPSPRKLLYVGIKTISPPPWRHLQLYKTGGWRSVQLKIASIQSMFCIASSLVNSPVWISEHLGFALYNMLPELLYAWCMKPQALEVWRGICSKKIVDIHFNSSPPCHCQSCSSIVGWQKRKCDASTQSQWRLQASGVDTNTAQWYKAMRVFTFPIYASDLACWTHWISLFNINVFHHNPFLWMDSFIIIIWQEAWGSWV